MPEALRGLGTYGFLFFALTYWPIAGPVAGYLIETRPGRRKCFLALIIAGITIGFYLLFMAIKHPVPPMAGPEWRGHIAYLVGVELPQGIEYLYFFTACLALLGSSNRTAFRFGLALTVSFAVTMVAYQLDTLPSVWCFFAALCSLIIVHAVWRRDIQSETPAAVGEK